MNGTEQTTGLDLSQVNMVDLFDDSTPTVADTTDAVSQDLTTAGNVSEPDKGDDQNLDNDTDSQASAEADASSTQTTGDGTDDHGDAGDQIDDTADSSDDDNADPSVISELDKILGYEVEGDFEDSYQGIASYTQSVAEKIADTKLAEIFQQMPEVQKFMQYRINGGDPQKYFQTSSQASRYAGVEIAEDNTSMQKQVVSALMEHQGYNTEEISESLEDLEDTGLLF
jgi:hypothetical protein